MNYTRVVRSSGLRRSTGIAVLAMAALSGCAQTQWKSGNIGQAETLYTADQTMDLELTDRVNRFERLSRVQGITPPQIQQVTLSADRVPGANRPIPVIRVTFNERDFFTTGSASPLPGAVAALQVIAQNMQRDVPDIQVTVLGHTDSTGSDQVNASLSEARAQSVVQSLVANGVNPGQLSAVAVGSAQPIAPNDTQDGRARNRRVEFLISPSEQANLTVVSMRPVNPAFLALGRMSTRVASVSTHRRVALLKPAYSGPTDFSEAPAARSKNISLASAGPDLAVGDDDTGSPVTGVTTRTIQEAGSPGETGSPVTSMSASYPPATH